MEEIIENVEELEKIFAEIESDLHLLEGDNCYMGLQILAKYTDNLIRAAEHDIVYSISAEELVDLKLKKEDAIQLSKLNWMISEDSLACFV